MSNIQVYIIQKPWGKHSNPVDECPVNLASRKPTINVVDFINRYNLGSGYVSGFDDMKKFLFKLFKSGYVTTGWGLSGLDLNLDIADWAHNYIVINKINNNNVRCEEAIGCYKSLKILKNIKKNDILVLPYFDKDTGYMNKNDRCTVVKVKGKYFFVDNIYDKNKNGWELDFGHRIEVDSNSAITLNTTDLPFSFSAYRKRVIRIKNDIYSKYIRDLF